jgi:hypothetical protein
MPMNVKMMLVVLIVIIPVMTAIPTKRIDVHVFYSEPCGACSVMKEFLDEMAIHYPTMVIHEHNILEEGTLALYDLFDEVYDLNLRGHPVPIVFIGKDHFQGYSPTIRELIQKKLEGCFTADGCSIAVNVEKDCIVIVDSTPTPEISTISLLPFVILAGIVCALTPYTSEVVSTLKGAQCSLYFIGFFVTSFLLCFALANIVFVIQILVSLELPVVVVAVLLGVLSLLSVKIPILRVPHSFRTAMNNLIDDNNGFSFFTLGIGVCLVSLLYNAGIYLLIVYNVLPFSLIDKLYYFSVYNVLVLVVSLLLFMVKRTINAFHVVVGAGSIALAVLFWLV